MRQTLSANRSKLVGWAERSEPHRNQAKNLVGLAAFGHPYILRSRLGTLNGAPESGKIVGLPDTA